MKHYCSIKNCKKLAVIKRWILGVGPCPTLLVFLCSNCKDIPLWNEDIVKEEKIGENENVV